MSTEFIAPKTLDAALEALRERPNAVVLAGGTDLWPHWTGSGPRPQLVLSLHRLAALSRIEQQDGELRIGALCTHRQLGSSELVQEAAPALAAAAKTVGAAQIQNRGTLGGNLANASPAADLPPALLAAEAVVELASCAGKRELPLRDFFIAYRTVDRRPDELLVAVRLRPLPAGSNEFFRKVGTRKAQAISKVVAAARIALSAQGQVTQATLAFGSVAATPLRLTSVEQWLKDKPLAAARAAVAAQVRAAVNPIDDLRSSAAYRRHVSGAIVEGWLTALAARAH